MPTEHWTVDARVHGAFYIEPGELAAPEPRFAGLKAFTLSPAYDGEKLLDGQHDIKLTLELPTREDAIPQAREVMDQAKRAIHFVVARLAIAAGRAVTLNAGISVTQQSPTDPSRYRAIMSAIGTNLAPPVKLSTAMITPLSQPTLERAIQWWSRAMGIPDIVDRLKALTVALDLVAGSVELAQGRDRRCKQCGFTETLKPGLKEKVIAFLTVENQIDSGLAQQIYETRNDLTHGGKELTEERLRSYRKQASLVASAVRRGIASRLGVQLEPLPDLELLDVDAFLLDVEYTLPRDVEHAVGT